MPVSGVNFSLWTLCRKWPYRRIACGQTGMVSAVVAVFVLVLWTTPVDARSRRGDLSDNPFGNLFQDFGAPRRASRSKGLAGIPLPRPRPAEAPALEPRRETAAPVPFPAPLPVPLPESRPAQAEPHPPVPSQAAPQVAEPAAPPEPPPPSACRLALTDQIAIAPSIPDITGPGACGGTDLVRLEAIVISGKGNVPLKPAATLRCEMATAVAGWIRDDMAPLAATLGTSLAELDNFDSFDCRGRNRVRGAKMSEHGRANALDVRGLKFANGQFVSLTDRASSRDTREKVLQSVCTRFTTVLGPGSDGYHEDHIHLDIAARRGGYRICQWDIQEPMPQIAPLLPAERPAEAPPRQVAEGKTQDGKPQTQPAAAQPPPNAEEEADPEPAPPPKPVKKNRRRRSY